MLDNYFKSATHKHRWLTFKHYAGIAAVVIIFIVFIIVIIASLFAEPKIPATSEEVRAAIVNQGYEPLDHTESYYETDDSFKPTLISCVAFEKDDIHFEFFEFNNNNSPKNIYRQAYQKITIKYNSWQQIETEERIANYRLYTLDCHGKYNVAIFVENTAVYAYCDSVNKNEINKILESIDYLRSGNNRDES